MERFLSGPECPWVVLTEAFPCACGHTHADAWESPSCEGRDSDLTVIGDEEQLSIAAYYQAVDGLAAIAARGGYCGEFSSPSDVYRPRGNRGALGLYRAIPD